MISLREFMASAWCGPEPLSGPAPLDWVLVAIAAAIVAFAFYKATLYTLRPGEREPTHIKRRILDDEAHE